MSYPSIISQEGSAQRNLAPILGALEGLIESQTTKTVEQDARSNVLEIGSFPYAHIRAFASRWKDIDWWGSVRDEHERREVVERLKREQEGDQGEVMNLHPPLLLDISDDEHWDGLRHSLFGKDTPTTLTGILMLNIIHCCPAGAPEQVFKHLSSIGNQPDGQGTTRLIREGGWVAAYGPFLSDDGGYKSPADEKFDEEYIRAQHPSLGLRSIPSITAMAERRGFNEAYREEMPKGNTFVVWRFGARDI